MASTSTDPTTQSVSNITHPSNPVGCFAKVKTDHNEDHPLAYVGQLIPVKRGQDVTIEDRTQRKDGSRWVKVKLLGVKNNKQGWIPYSCLAVNWPVNYPCRAKHSFEDPPSGLSSKFYQMMKGDEGTVTHRHVYRDGSVWVHVLALSELEKSWAEREKGWVPLDFLEIGPNAIGDRTVKDNINRDIRINNPRAVGPDRIHKAFCAVLSTLASHKETFELDFLRHNFVKATRTTKLVDELCFLAAEGVRMAGMADCFSKPYFSLSDMRHHATPVDENNRDQRSGIYIIIYSFDGTRLDEIYIGATKNFFNRYMDHKTVARTGKFQHSQHYNAARSARSMTMLPICILSSNEPMLTRNIVEQIFILLFDSYHPLILECEPTATGNSPAEIKEKTQRYIRQKIAAIKLRIASSAALENVGWTGGCQRQVSVGALEFEATIGLNWGSPLLESAEYSSLVWTRVDYENKLAEFRRTGYKVVVEHGSVVAGQIGYISGNSYRDLVRLTIPTDEGEVPKAGDTAYLIAEIRLDGQPHDYPWAMLMSEGPFTDWQHANRLGIRVEWESSTGTKSKYIHAHRGMRFVSDSPGALFQYDVAMAMIRYLLQKKRAEPRDWERDLGIASVKQISFDHFTQTVQIQDRLPSSHDDPRARRRTFNEFRNGFLQAGLARVGGPFGYTPPLLTTTDKPRKTCDACFINSRSYFGRPGVWFRDRNTLSAKCEEIPNTGTCQFCWSFGRPCTWSPVHTLRDNMAVYRVLTFVTWPAGGETRSVNSTLEEVEG